MGNLPSHFRDSGVPEVFIAIAYLREKKITSDRRKNRLKGFIEGWSEGRAIPRWVIRNYAIYEEASRESDRILGSIIKEDGSIDLDAYNEEVRKVILIGRNAFFME